MPSGALTFRGTTLIAAAATPMGNGGGYWSIASERARTPIDVPIEAYNVSGLVGVLRAGYGNIEPAAGAYIIGGQCGRGRARGYYTDWAAADAWIGGLEALRKGGSTGTLVLGSKGAVGVTLWWRDFQRSAIMHCALGNCSVCVDYVFEFVKLS